MSPGAGVPAWTWSLLVSPPHGLAGPVSWHWRGIPTDGETDPILSAPPLYLALGGDGETRQHANRELFAGSPDDAIVADLRLASNQAQPIGNASSYAEIEAVTGQRRALKTRGRPE